VTHCGQARVPFNRQDTDQQVAWAESRADLREAVEETRAAFNRLYTDLHILGTHITRHDTCIDGVHLYLSVSKYKLPSLCVFICPYRLSLFYEYRRF
jgi:hypothetical protein